MKATLRKFTILAVLFVVFISYMVYLHNNDGQKIKIFTTASDSQETRLQRYKEWCQRHPNQTDPFLKRSLTRTECIANDYTKVLFCPIPKCGCSSWKAVMVFSTPAFRRKYPNISLSNIYAPQPGKKPEGAVLLRVHSRSYLREFGLKLVKLKNINTEYEDYFKFLFVREPFHRLISAYRDKLARQSEVTGTQQWEIGEDIIKFYRKPGSAMNIEDSKYPTFNEFLHYLNDHLGKGIVDIHYDSYNFIYAPCVVKFDFIGKVETMAQDGKVVLEKLFPRKPTYDIPIQNANPFRETESSEKYFNTVDRDTVKLLVAKLADDFELYGYDPTPYTRLL